MLKLVSGSHSVHQIGLHLVWCTKYRKPVLDDVKSILIKQVVGQVCIDNEWTCHTIEVMPDHVHLFLQIAPTDAPCDVVRILKSITATAIFATYPKLKGTNFWGSGLWSRGTYYGSVGSVSQEAIIKYIENQKTK